MRYAKEKAKGTSLGGKSAQGGEEQGQGTQEPQLSRAAGHPPAPERGRWQGRSVLCNIWKITRLLRGLEIFGKNYFKYIKIKQAD